MGTKNITYVVRRPRLPSIHPSNNISQPKLNLLLDSKQKSTAEVDGSGSKFRQYFDFG